MPESFFEWDPAKALANVRKHGVEFSDAVTALGDELSITIADPDAQVVERYVSIGTDAYGRLLVTVYAIRSDVVRIISARKATRRERMTYEEHR